MDWSSKLRKLITTPLELTKAQAPNQRKVVTRGASEQPVTNEFLTEALHKHLEALQNWFQPILSPIIEKIIEQETKIEGFQGWLSSLEERMDKYEKRVEDEISGDSSVTVNELKAQLASQKAELLELKNRTPNPSWIREIRNAQQRAEDERRANNIIIHGLKRERMDAPRHAQEFFTKKLEIRPSFERASWLGGSPTAPLLVTLTDTRDKGLIFKNCWRLRGSPISVKEDLSQDTRQERRRQLDTYKRLRDQGLRPQFRGPRLFVGGKLYVDTFTRARPDEDTSNRRQTEDEDPEQDGGEENEVHAGGSHAQPRST